MTESPRDVALQTWRTEKDRFFKFDFDSPIPDEAREAFKGLNYFPEDKSYRFSLDLSLYTKPEIVSMTTSKGATQSFFRQGFFTFGFQGKQVRLQAYRSAEREDKHLFIPFRDKTSGKETYGAARYIDLDLAEDHRYVLDFNYAYNPYCAYSENYVCPLPPPENWLDVEISAGEKKYHD